VSRRKLDPQGTPTAASRASGLRSGLSALGKHSWSTPQPSVVSSRGTTIKGYRNESGRPRNSFFRMRSRLCHCCRWKTVRRFRDLVAPELHWRNQWFQFSLVRKLRRRGCVRIASSIGVKGRFPEIASCTAPTISPTLTDWQLWIVPASSRRPAGITRLPASPRCVRRLSPQTASQFRV
jgi:hypothetical protein